MAVVAWESIVRYPSYMVASVSITDITEDGTTSPIKTTGYHMPYATSLMTGLVGGVLKVDLNSGSSFADEWEQLKTDNHSADGSLSIGPGRNFFRVGPEIRMEWSELSGTITAGTIDLILFMQRYRSPISSQ